MQYVSLQLKNFRSYTNYAVELNKGVNIVVGPNASGKTNLLEAIQVLSLGNSFRSPDKELIGFGKSWMSIQGALDDGQERQLSIRQEKSIKIDGNKYKRLSLQKQIPITLFEPEHLRMIQGSPELRRSYLDGILKQTLPGYASVLSKYKRAVAQRNALLKKENISKDELFVWDIKMTELASKIVEQRKKLIQRINRQASKIYSELSNKKSTVNLKYISSIKQKDYATGMLNRLQKEFEEDRRKGFTSSGPHREDINLILNRHNALNTASRGESRTIVLVLKLIELKLIEEARDKTPILLLDDVFSELDSARRKALTDYLKNHQTIITTTDADAIIKHFIGSYNIIPTEG